MHLNRLILPNSHQLLILNPQVLDFILKRLYLCDGCRLVTDEEVELLLVLREPLLQIRIPLNKRLRHHGNDRHLFLILAYFIQRICQFLFRIEILSHLLGRHHVLVAPTILRRNFLLYQGLEIVHVDVCGATIKIQHRN